MYEELTGKQKEVLMYIKTSVQLNGYPPSIREICKGVNIKSTSSAHSYLEKLESLGYIRKNPTQPRTIEIIDQEDDHIFSPKKTIDIPIIGEVTAGEPILAVENITDTFPLSTNFVGEKDLFILKVKGDSMINAGIFNDDLAIITKQNTAKNGDIVLALIDDEYSTIKTFYKEKENYRLQPENDALNPIISTNVSILGILKGIIRLF